MRSIHNDLNGECSRTPFPSDGNNEIRGVGPLGETGLSRSGNDDNPERQWRSSIAGPNNVPQLERVRVPTVRSDCLENRAARMATAVVRDYDPIAVPQRYEFTPELVKYNDVTMSQQLVSGACHGKACYGPQGEQDSIP